MSAMNPTAKLPADILEVRAAEQRRRIHETVLELRQQVRDEVNDKLDIRKHAAHHVWSASGVAAAAGLLFGWGAAAMFSSPQ